MEFSKAKSLAEQYMNFIAPGCARVEIVGSVKRGDSANVHDIEILCIDAQKPMRIEFGMKRIMERVVPKTRLGTILDDLCQDGLLKLVMGGEKLRKYEILEVPTMTTVYTNPFHLEIYIVRQETWGIQNVIRTGPKEFSHMFVMNRKFGGLLPDDLEYVRGETKILSGGAALNLPEERDALALIGYGWVEPGKRKQLAVSRQLSGAQ